MPDPTQPVIRYSAFVSYSRCDNRVPGQQWANWVHETLETYRIPKKLIREFQSQGLSIRRTLHPVFQDLRELAAHDSLTEAIGDGLRNSETLVVICSPSSVDSVWVNDEIIRFRHFHPTGKILAVVVAGTPMAGKSNEASLGVNARSEALPLPLRHPLREDLAPSFFDFSPINPAEAVNCEVDLVPLWLDLRLPEGVCNSDGTAMGYTSTEALEKAMGPASRKTVRRAVSSLAKKLHETRLELIAGVLGVTKGQLERRDEERAGRTLKAWFVGVSVALLAFAVITVWAIIERSAAVAASVQADKERIRAESARGRADRRLDALRRSVRAAFEGAGRPDIAETIGKVIEDDLEQEYLESSQPEQLRSLAQIQVALAQVDAFAGQLESCEARARKVVNLLSALAAKGVTDRESQMLLWNGWRLQIWAFTNGGQDDSARMASDSALRYVAGYRQRFPKDQTAELFEISFRLLPPVKESDSQGPESDLAALAAIQSQLDGMSGEMQRTPEWQDAMMEFCQRKCTLLRSLGREKETGPILHQQLQILGQMAARKGTVLGVLQTGLLNARLARVKAMQRDVDEVRRHIGNAKQAMAAIEPTAGKAATGKAGLLLVSQLKMEILGAERMLADAEQNRMESLRLAKVVCEEWKVLYEAQRDALHLKAEYVTALATLAECQVSLEPENGLLTAQLAYELAARDLLPQGPLHPFVFAAHRAKLIESFILAKKQNWVEAAAASARSAELLAEVAARQPMNASVREHLVPALHMTAQFLIRSGEPLRATDAFRLLCDQGEQLRKLRPGNVDSARQSAQNHIAFARHIIRSTPGVSGVQQTGIARDLLLRGKAILDQGIKDSDEPAIQRMRREIMELETSFAPAIPMKEDTTVPQNAE